MGEDFLSCVGLHVLLPLLQVWEFACCFGPLLGLEKVPSPQQLEAGLLGLVSHTGTMASSMARQLADAQQQQQQQPVAMPPAQPAASATAAAAAVLGSTLQGDQLQADAAAGLAWVQLHVGILSLLLDDVFQAVAGATFDMEHMKAGELRDLRAAAPHVSRFVHS